MEGKHFKGTKKTYKENIHCFKISTNYLKALPYA